MATVSRWLRCDVCVKFNRSLNSFENHRVRDDDVGLSTSLVTASVDRLLKSGAPQAGRRELLPILRDAATRGFNASQRAWPIKASHNKPKPMLYSQEVHSEA